MTNCTNPRCEFFLDSPSNACPACGRPVLWPPHRTEVAVGAAVVVLALTVWAMAGAGFAAVFGLLMVLAVGCVLWLVRWRGQTRLGTLDERYREAVDRSIEWNRRWHQLFERRALAAAGSAADSDDLNALQAALDAASEAETSWSELRNRLGAGYVDNALDRLSYLATIYRRGRGLHWSSRCRYAIALVDRQLEVLWIDHGYRSWAEREVDAFRGFVSRAELAIELDAISLIHPPSPPVSGLIAARGVGLDLPDDVDDDIVFHRARLLAEVDLSP